MNTQAMGMLSQVEWWKQQEGMHSIKEDCLKPELIHREVQVSRNQPIQATTIYSIPHPGKMAHLQYQLERLKIELRKRHIHLWCNVLLLQPWACDKFNWNWTHTFGFDVLL